MSEQIRQILEDHNYEMLGELGRGGMGVVYLAQHRKLGRRVAIKTLTPERISKDNSMARFVREAQVFAAIHHPHIANLYEFEDQGPIAFLALEYVEGTDLEKERRRGRRWTPQEAAELLLAMADALSHTHEKGILHRDIKPGNILIENKTNRVVLTDFGLAKSESDATLTAAGFAVGTPAYMAPEQITDRFGGKPDGRADIFSLGTVAYEMLTLDHPFLAKDDLNTMRNIVNGTMKPIREVNDSVPEGLANIIESMLEKNPADRIENADKLVEKLRRFLGMTRPKSDSQNTPVNTPPAKSPSAASPAHKAPDEPAGGLSSVQLIVIIAAACLITLIIGIVLGYVLFVV